jgi:rSAM/selenodomain-associated transferase 2
MAGRMISVIIPALNEEAYVRSCLEAIRQEDDTCEIIVVDGGSADRTIEIAEGFQGVKVLRTDRGRGLQMNAGASSASGEALLFLHADTILQRGWRMALERTLQDTSVAGGAFTFAIDSPLKRYRAVEQWVKFRCFIFKLPYGDQGIFVRTAVYEKIKGFKNMPIMEDVELIGRLKKQGKISVLGTSAFTSERRWLEKGLLYTAVINQLIMLLYRLGISPKTLAKIYYR